MVGEVDQSVRLDHAKAGQRRMISSALKESLPTRCTVVGHSGAVNIEKVTISVAFRQLRWPIITVQPRHAWLRALFQR